MVDLYKYFVFNPLNFWQLSQKRLFQKTCGRLSIFSCLRELPTSLVSINATQILQARKQMECDNNKY